MRSEWQALFPIWSVLQFHIFCLPSPSLCQAWSSIWHKPYCTVDFDHSANTCTGKSTIMSVIHSIAVSKVAGENLSVRVFSVGLLKQGCQYVYRQVIMLYAWILKEYLCLSNYYWYSLISSDLGGCGNICFVYLCEKYLSLSFPFSCKNWRLAFGPYTLFVVLGVS